MREAFGYLFDFAWVNKNLFGGVYRRTASYFDGSDLSRRTASRRKERALLGAVPGCRPRRHPRRPLGAARSDGSGRDRDLARRAIALLSGAGYEREGRSSQPRTGEPLAFEILVISRDQERHRAQLRPKPEPDRGPARVRLVDSVQYERRRQRFDFDMMIASWPVSPSPGNEQFFRWGSASADREGSFNFAGVTSPAVDGMIQALLAAEQRDDFAAAVRALDRVLLSGFYVVPFIICRTSGSRTTRA